jgi:uncharacterized protein
VDVETTHGLARAHAHEADDPRATLFLGHGAGGGVAAPDLQAVTEAALARRLSVALVEQPYRVAGRRSPAPAGQLDAAWIQALAHLQASRDVPLIAGGRSAGARVACRTARETGAAAVLCLAFPVRAPGRPDKPSRRHELDAVEVPVLVIQGEQDPFGMPESGPNRTVVKVRGNHSLRADLPAVAQAAGDWLDRILAPARVSS